MLSLALYAACVGQTPAPAAKDVGYSTIATDPLRAGKMRPRDIWVFRSVLDKHARMVTIGLSDDLWVAYDATNCGLYKAWKGGVKFDGAVYTTVHGPQPTSEGSAYAEWDPGMPAWTYSAQGKGHTVHPRFRGYRFVNGHVHLDYEIDLGPGRTVKVSDGPEFVTKNGKPGLERRFRVTGLPTGFKLGVVIPGAKEAETVVSGATLSKDEPVTATFSKDGLAYVTTYFNPQMAYRASVNPGIEGGASAQQEQQPREPGLAMRIYQVNKSMSQLPRLVPNQTPNVSRTVPQVDFEGTESFGASSEDKFYCELSGFIKIPSSGKYEFQLTSDDGSTLYIGGKLVVDHDGLHGAEGAVGEATLSAGSHPIAIHHFENEGGATLKLEWRKPGDKEFSVVPTEALETQRGEVHVTSPGDKMVLGTIDWSKPGDGRPLEGVHPSYKLTQARPDAWHVKVGGIDFLPDGRMVVCAWEPDGGVYVVSNYQSGDPAKIKVKRIAAGLAEPLGLKVVNGAIYVLQKQELTKLVDTDGDGAIDQYYALANGWGVTANFHEFAFGLVHHDHHFWATLATAINPGGRSTQPQEHDRGRVVKINDKTGAFQFVAAGLRTPNGIGMGSFNGVYVTDNQGDWLPSSKLVFVKQGAFYGNRSVEPVAKANTPETPPVVWLPQGEIGNSPSQPAPLNDGPYRGQMIHGDVTHGGLKRVFVENVDGQLQGCVFRMTQGLEAGVNRIAWGPDGALYIGGVGSTGNWGQEGKLLYGLQRWKYTGAPTFEMLAVRAMTNGLEIEFTEPLAAGAGQDPATYRVEQWYYKPTATYGGPKMGLAQLEVKGVQVSQDRRSARLVVAGIKPGYVVHVRLDSSLPSQSGRSLWSTEAWYTMNRIPKGKVVTASIGSDARPSVNALTKNERSAGFVSLFNGESLDGWRGYGNKETPVAWAALDGAVTFTPGLPGGDLATKESFGDFDFRFDWRVTSGGNSGVIYRVSEDKPYPWETGPEYQVLDDAKHADGKDPLTSAASLYGLVARGKKVVRPAGVWNEGRIVARGGKVEHWLNGVKVLEYDTAAPDWEAKVKASKFGSMPDFAKNRAGHIVLQDHGDPVAYRNLRIKRL
ncbi:MAG: DUF1080 domain-containing protein [Fimbriimonadaceae bacterium]|nr:DUF1080 domain-containing protein [Fimbriimonadaceae bacterium]QYK55590.1 MAG: DUF1080 domain-containing protein [Fimbriimonadaceae bacterium]